MAYLTDNQNQRIIANPSVIATIYNNFWPAFGNNIAPLNGSINSQLFATAFASTVAWNLKPYGPEKSGVVDLPGILAEPTIACDVYVMLAYYLAQLIPQANGTKFTFLGWNGGAVGNHAQMLASANGQSILLDPTVGLMALNVTYDSLASGKPVPVNNVVSLFTKFGGTPSIAGFSATVQDAVINGKYKPSDALYYFSSFPVYISTGIDANTPTPQAQSPTP